MKHLSKLSDEELVVLYSEGNNKAFDILLTRYKNRIYSYIFYTVKDNDLTEDIFQETFVKVITTIKLSHHTPDTCRHTPPRRRAARQPTRGTHHALLQKHEFQRNCRRYAGKHQHGIGPYALRPAQHQKNGRRSPNTTFFLKKQTAYILNTHGLTF